MNSIGGAIFFRSVVVALLPRLTAARDDPAARDEIWWGAVNRPVDPAEFDRMHEKVADYLAARSLYVFDGFAGADASYLTGFGDFFPGGPDGGAWGLLKLTPWRIELGGMADAAAGRPSIHRSVG